MSSCIFCKIISKEIDGKIVYEDDQWLAFDDINPQAPVHVLIVPREHIPTLNDLKENHREIIGNMGVVINKIAEIKNVKDPGFRVVINCNTAGGQLVYHLHVHLLGGRQMTWPPG
ncbi:MAG TPA: histidine triad nucleotide-binding protein [Nitrospirota bacterium]|mgnify:CR=1 FL=1|nr:histidine triad nucleotide-binding protein [Nitrospirota bacterium]